MVDNSDRHVAKSSILKKMFCLSFSRKEEWTEEKKASLNKEGGGRAYNFNVNCILRINNHTAAFANSFLTRSSDSPDTPDTSSVAASL